MRTRVNPVHRLALALLMLAATSGCYREAELGAVSSQLDRWVGRSAAELREKLGEPSFESQSEEGQLWEFTSEQGCLLFVRVDLTHTIGQAFWAGPEAACQAFIPKG